MLCNSLVSRFVAMGDRKAKIDMGTREEPVDVHC